MSYILHFEKVDSASTDFISLVGLLNRDLEIRDGEEQGFYKQYNKIDNLRHVIVAFADGIAVGCGAIKPYDDVTMEIKRMFVLFEMRGQGIAGKILDQLENWTKELGYLNTILETGKRQPEAIRLYLKKGYRIIPNYGQYVGIENSICMTKALL